MFSISHAGVVLMNLQICSIQPTGSFKADRPISICTVEAGFPSPAEDWIEKIDLDSWLFKNPNSTFLVRVSGQSMTSHGIFSGDVLVVDRALKPRDGSIVVAVMHDSFLVKQLILKPPKTLLRSGHGNYPDIEVTEFDEFEVWGVVRYTIHEH